MANKQNQTVNGKIDRFFKRSKNFIKVISYVGKQNFIAHPTANIYAVSLLVFGGLLQVLALLLITLLLSGNISTAGVFPSLFIANWFNALSISFMKGVSILTGIFILAAFCTYRGETRILKLATELEFNLKKNLLNYLGTVAGAMQVIEKKHSFPYLTKVLNGSTRLAGRVLRLQYTLIQPLLKATILLGVLLAMDLAVTLAILGFLFLFGVIHYNINLRATKYSKQFEESNIASRNLLRLKLGSAVLNLGTKSKEANDFSQDKDILLNEESYRMRLQVTEESKFMSSLAKAVIILFLLATITEFGKLQSQHVMEMLLSYALVLLVFLLSLQSTLACLTNISRFHPQVSRYVNLLSNSGISLSQFPMNCLFIPIYSNDGKKQKYYLSDTSTLLVVCSLSQVSNTHIGILSSIIKNNKKASQKEGYPSTVNEKDIKSKKGHNVLLSHVVGNSIQETMDQLKSNENCSLQIIYITPANAKVIANNQPVYEYSHKTARLESWSEKSMRYMQTNENLEEDDVDDI